MIPVKKAQKQSVAQRDIVCFASLAITGFPFYTGFNNNLKKIKSDQHQWIFVMFCSYPLLSVEGFVHPEVFLLFEMTVGVLF
jgi:nitrate reductase NapE component